MSLSRENFPRDFERQLTIFMELVFSINVFLSREVIDASCKQDLDS